MKCPDAAGAECARTVVFPYLQDVIGEAVDGKPAEVVRIPNWGRTAAAIVVGLRPLKIAGELPASPDAENIRKALRRA